MAFNNRIGILSCANSNDSNDDTFDNIHLSSNIAICLFCLINNEILLFQCITTLKFNSSFHDTLTISMHNDTSKELQ